MTGNISGYFKRILEQYLLARTQPFAQHPIREEFSSACAELKNLEFVRNNPYLRVEWSVGKGNWAKVPWIAFLDSRETDTTQYGIYGVFLFRQDMTGVYLTLAQGVTRLIENQGRTKAHLTLRERADALARTCNPLLSKGFSTDGNIDLRADAGLGADYQASTISYKLFQPEAFQAPSFGATINDDIQALLQIYREYKDKGRAVTTIIQPYSYPEICSNFHKNCNSTDCGLSFSIETICNFIASLAAKPFLVLTGLSGSGKTKLAQAFVRWLTPDSSLFGDSGSVDSNPQYALIPVGADWTGNENILGYPDGLDSSRYVSKPALEVILHAHNHPELPHFLILDEMNLSHVERYFADMLSAIESGEPVPLYEGADRSKDGTTKIPQRVSVPGNLFIIGTVNVDETTYMFSPKVLDRANVIEFRMDSRELGSFLKNPTKPDFGKLDGAGVAFARTFVNRAKSSVTVPTEIATRFEEEMLLLFNVLQSSGAEFGYRVAQEASRFVHYYKELGAFSPDDTKWFDDALDAVIVQKLLPKLHGSRGKLEGLLWALATFCGGERTGTTEAFLTECLAAAKCEDEAKFSPEAVDQKLRAANPERKARYASSFDKILRMYRKLVRDQFVTFAEA